MNEELERILQSFEADASLLQADKLSERLQVLDTLDAHFGADPDALTLDVEEATSLCRRAAQLSTRLDAVNRTLYAGLRAEIRRGGGAAALLRWVPSANGTRGSSEHVVGMGYDGLDDLVCGVLPLAEPDLPLGSEDPEMVFWQPTPARHIFRLIELTALIKDDVLVDLGSGLGHVPLLVSICTAARSSGIEREASYVARARECARDLHLSGVTFIQQDVRTADLSTGTVFYLHTPFTGSIMRTVLDRLKGEAAARPIRVCTYGPCTSVLTGERWLRAETPTETDQIAIFLSVF